MKIRPVGAELFHADREQERYRRMDRRTDGQTRTDAFRNFAKSAQNYLNVHPNEELCWLV